MAPGPHEPRSDPAPETVRQTGPLLTYFALVFAISWSCWIPVARGVPIGSAPGRMLVLLGTFSPGIVSLALTYLRSGSAGVSALLARVLPRAVAARWVVFALG